MSKWVYLFVGGGLGTGLRYLLSGLVYDWLGSRFPFGTLAVNCLGCFVIGFLVVLAEEKFVLSPQMQLMLLVGALGAFTTFSTFILETANLIRDGQTGLAFLNVAGSVVAGFILFRAGVLAAELI